MVDLRLVAMAPVAIMLQMFLSGPYWKEFIAGDIGVAVSSRSEHQHKQQGHLEVQPHASIVRERLRGAFYAALVGDALCLGSHYEYDAQKIEAAYRGKAMQLLSPGEYFGGKTVTPGWQGGEGQVKVWVAVLYWWSI